MANYESEMSINEDQAPIFKSLAGIAHFMALKCAIDLRLSDILHSYENPITLSQLASSIDSPTPPDISALKRIMRMLVSDKFFSAYEPLDVGGEILYGTTKTSSWLVSDSEMSLTHFFPLVYQPTTFTMWSYLSRCVTEGGTAFEKVFGCKPFEFGLQNPEYNNIFNSTMVAQTKGQMVKIMKAYKDGFQNIVGSLVDVGGGIGQSVATIVKENSHINGINFDLPQVISAAPEYNGVTHVAGDMFESIPKADAIFIKLILHNWSDEECIKILKNCKEAIPKEGKVIIVDSILSLDANNDFNETGLYNDLLMLAAFGGKERTELEWKKLLEDGGFPRYKIVNVDLTVSLIEAYPG